MSHSHSHAPGQPTHSHGPPPPNPQQQQAQQQQMKQMMPAPDPVMQAVIEASFVPVDIAFGPPDNATALCQAHSQQKCTECDVDFITLNRLSTLLHMNPNLRCPPPPTATSKNLSVFITKTKEEGNTAFKEKNYQLALQRYTMALSYATQRPPWEQSQFMREELATVFSNRSACHFEMGDQINALVDAEMVIQLKKPWSKGYFRKAKALLQMHQYAEAKETIELGLSFEENNFELLSMLTSAKEGLSSGKPKEQ